MSISQDIEKNISVILRNIEQSCAKAARPVSEIKITAVSKKQSVEKMNAYHAFCIKNSIDVIFGESYVQEFRDKRSTLLKPYESHLIGALQSNKAKDAVFIFDLVQSVHSGKLAKELDKEAKKISKRQRIYIQINISNDQAKSGFNVEEGRNFILNELPTLSNLELHGLMTITKDYETAEGARADYRALRIFREQLLSSQPAFKNALALSMGMSHDYQIAIEEGADIVRIGTALFGTRDI